MALLTCSRLAREYRAIVVLWSAGLTWVPVEDVLICGRCRLESCCDHHTRALQVHKGDLTYFLPSNYQGHLQCALVLQSLNCRREAFSLGGALGIVVLQAVVVSALSPDPTREEQWK